MLLSLFDLLCNFTYLEIIYDSFPWVLRVWTFSILRASDDHLQFKNKDLFPSCWRILVARDFQRAATLNYLPLAALVMTGDLDLTFISCFLESLANIFLVYLTQLIRAWTLLFSTSSIFIVRTLNLPNAFNVLFF